jgi:1-deoxy-D-xylulose-5-phosphate reductoisomerase
MRDVNNPRSITILGSTGSVGCNTVDLIKRSEGSFRVVALTANTAVENLARQAIDLAAELAVVADQSRYEDLKRALSGSGVEAAAGMSGLLEAAGRPAEFVMAAIVGAAGLPPTLAAIERGATVGLANKETLVCAGKLMIDACARNGAKLIPVDSEHNAIFQVLEEGHRASIRRIILTASGGPFRSMPLSEMSHITPAQAVAHPNWDMGPKISVDSATMMNKGLELIEARYLFDLPEDRIDILVHPQSVIHSLVAYDDGSVLAQLGQPDMRTPISYAMAWPGRMSTPVAELDLARIASLTFEAPDHERFPAMGLARTSLGDGASAPIVLNAANEVAVEAFLGGRIGFLDVIDLVARALDKVPHRDVDDLEAVIEFDRAARRQAIDLLPVYAD